MSSGRRTHQHVLGAIIACLIGMTQSLATVDSRIWNGEEVGGNIYPWVCSLRLDNTHVCGCTIISVDHVLTAAHCLSEMSTIPVDAARVSLRVGSVNQYAGGSLVKVQHIDIHPSFGNFMHDLAVMKLTTSLSPNEKVSAIPFAAADDVTEAGEIVTIAGWGLLKTGVVPYRLQHTTMTVLSQPRCEYEAGYGYDSTLCMEHAVGEGVCRGDDGAGVITKGKLVGTISFAFGGCGTKYPDVATNIAYYSAWIKEKMAM